MDGQNLFHAAREAFGYTYPNYDVSTLAEQVCAGKGWGLAEVRFYTGIPSFRDDPRWNRFWTRKLAAMGRQGVEVYGRTLRYGREKGIDVRIALDVIALAHRREYDVALIMSQDQDFSEVAEEVRTIARAQRRWIEIASAFPDSSDMGNRREINKTDWIRINRALCDRCLDPRDYRQGSAR